MIAPKRGSAVAPELLGLHLADDPGAWAAAGFAVHDDRCLVDGVIVHLGSIADASGIVAWSLSEVGVAAIDGLTLAAPPVATGVEPADHPNGTTAIDHVVAASGDLGRTTEALEAVGIVARRTRDTTLGASPLRQVFFRLGRPILELIGPPDPVPDRPTTFWGLALTVGDLDATKDVLGDLLGDPKDAVQPGRRIATLRTGALGISVPIAFMST